MAASIEEQRASTATSWEWSTTLLSHARRGALLDEAELDDPGELQAELHLLLPGPSTAMKLRRDRIEVKERTRRHASGIERWRTLPVRYFPLVGTDVEAMEALLCAPRGLTIDARRSQEEFLAELPFIAPDVRPLALRAWRRRYRWRGGAAEVATLVLPHGLVEIVRLEHADAGVLLESIADLGADVERGLSEPAMLKGTVGMSA